MAMKLKGPWNFWKKSWECKSWSTCTIWNGLWKYVIKMAGLFIKFVAKAAQTWENKKRKMGKSQFLRAIFF